MSANAHPCFAPSAAAARAADEADEADDLEPAKKCKAKGKGAAKGKTVGKAGSMRTAEPVGGGKAKKAK